MHWTDSHIHIVDFLQRPAPITELAAALHEGQVDRAVVFGLPVKKKWSTAEPIKPDYYLDDNAPCQYHSLTDILVLDAVHELDKVSGLHVAPLLCGFDPTDRLAVEHIDSVWSRSDRWAGIGEVLLRHDDLTNLTRGETPVADHVAMDNILDFCAQNRVPISVHHDSSSAGRPAQHEYAEPFERAVGRHRNTQIVWCHAGVSRRVNPDDQIDLVADLVERHDNLTVELSWVVLDRIVSDRGMVDRRWHDLICRLPERFVVGSDSVADPATIETRSAQVVRLLDGLPRSVADRIGSDNAGELWF